MLYCWFLCSWWFGSLKKKKSELDLPPSVVGSAEHGDTAPVMQKAPVCHRESSDMNWNQWPIKYLPLLFKAYSNFAK